MFKNIFFGFIFCYYILNIQFVHANSYIQKKIGGHTIKVIKYDLLSKDYIFKFGFNADYNASSLRELMEDNNGVSAINGVFFCPATYGECGGKDFTNNERYQDGEKISGKNNTNQRVTFALDKNNKPFLYHENDASSELNDNIYNGFSNFPLLLENGEKKIQDYIDAGLIDIKMKMNISRNFICSDKNGRYIYTGYIYNINLENIGDILLELGCYNALNLDAGGSSAMIYNARHIIGPGREIMDGIIIERKDLDTEKIRELSNKFIEKIETKFENYSYAKKIKNIDIIAQVLNNLRIGLYENNSRNLLNSDGEIHGYQIKMNSLHNLQIVYLLNHLNMKIYQLKQEYIQQELIDNPPIQEYSF